MKVGIFDPYFDTLGGGEKYISDIASYFLQEHEVFLFWNEEEAVKKAEARFQVSLTNLKVIKNIFTPSGNVVEKFLVTSKFDMLFYFSDGSVPLLFSKKNILIFQFPVNWIVKPGLFTKIKFHNIQKVLCYSDFVKRHIDKTFGIAAQVLPPAVRIIGSGQNKRKNMIITVGRFTRGMNAKKHDIMISAFKKMCENGLKNWEFVVIGSHLPKDGDLVEAVKKSIKGYPVKILANITRDVLEEYYKEAKIYWHAAGFGEDLAKHPERAEHFGISTVEAMGAGCVPVVINAGGQREIVTEGTGLLWNSIEELQEQTRRLVLDKDLWEEFSKNAKERAKAFSPEKFCEELSKLIA